MSVKRELVTCTELETEVNTSGNATEELSHGSASFVRIQCSTAFLFLGNASNGAEVELAADTWYRFPCFHQSIHLKQSTSAGLGDLDIIWEI